MAVHVGEIHTELSGASAPAAGEARQGEGQPRYPGASEDAWRRDAARLAHLQARVCAVDFED